MAYPESTGCDLYHVRKSFVSDCDRDIIATSGAVVAALHSRRRASFRFAWQVVLQFGHS